MNWYDEMPTLFLYQRLEFWWEELEKREYSDEIQKLLEEIGEKQCMLLNKITIQ